MIKRTFAPGFRIKLHQKDLALALAGARELGVALPQTAGAAQLMQALADSSGRARRKIARRKKISSRRPINVTR